jgi:glycosyltransferase involved in cell wall biosynthesis
MLARAADSVARQTLLPDAHHIAIDTQRAGAAVTRTRALASARTDWVAFLDSDDVFLPRHLELLLRHAEQTGADYVYSWFKLMEQGANGQTKIWETDPIFPVGHYLNEFDPTSEDTMIETTVTTLVRTELAQAVGFEPLDRGHDKNSGEDRFFLLGVVKAGGVVKHLKRKTWLWCHHYIGPGVMGNTSGLPTLGDAA